MLAEYFCVKTNLKANKILSVTFMRSGLCLRLSPYPRQGGSSSNKLVMTRSLKAYCTCTASVIFSVIQGVVAGIISVTAWMINNGGVTKITGDAYTLVPYEILIGIDVRALSDYRAVSMLWNISSKTSIFVKKYSSTPRIFNSLLGV